MHGEHRADVAVIGGGITGCTAAVLLARAGARVVVLDAQRIGRGSTAASTALLMQEPDVDFRGLSQRYGARRAKEIWERSRTSLRGLLTMLRALRLAGGVEPVPSVYFTCDGTIAKDLRRELARRHGAGFPGRWLSADALKKLTGIEGAGAILTPGNAQVDPYRACLGLARHARARGVELFERSPVVRVVRAGSGVRIELERGEVRADWAVIATGYATPEFKPLAGRFRMSNTYVIATRPIPAPARKEMGLGRVMLWDTDVPYHYARWTPGNRLLFGGRDRPQVRRGARRTVLQREAAGLMRDLGALYPALEGTSPDYVWEGLFATTPDGLPYVGPHRRYPRQLFALGYGGNGMSFGFMAAEILLRYVRGKETDGDRFFGFGRVR